MSILLVLLRCLVCLAAAGKAPDPFRRWALPVWARLCLCCSSKYVVFGIFHISDSYVRSKCLKSGTSSWKCLNIREPQQQDVVHFRRYACIYLGAAIKQSLGVKLMTSCRPWTYFILRQRITVLECRWDSEDISESLIWRHKGRLDTLLPGFC